jgi:hypothetical protein
MIHHGGTKDTKVSEVKTLPSWSPRLLKKYMEAERLFNEEITFVSSYLHMRVSRLIGRRPNLDSRLRVNDVRADGIWSSIRFHSLSTSASS